MSDRNELLDKAIADAKEAEDWQLVEWLRTARGSKSAAQWYSDKLRKVLRAERKLLNENAKLKELAKLMHDHINECCNACGERCICDIDALTRELGIEVGV